MKKLLNKTFLLLLLLPLLIACDKTDDFEPDFKYEYFPLKVGQYTIYDIDSIFYDDFFVPTKIDTSYYQIKEYIESEFTDLQGRTAFRIERFRRDSETQPWQFKNVWFAVRTDRVAERVEDNLRFIKLAFPPRTGIKWDGNQYIEQTEKLKFLENWEYNYLSVDVPETVNGHTFDSTLTVFQRDWDVLTNKVYAKEMYARNVGLIYREWIYLSKNDVTAPWTNAISGFIFRKKIADYGFE